MGRRLDTVHDDNGREEGWKLWEVGDLMCLWVGGRACMSLEYKLSSWGRGEGLLRLRRTNHCSLHCDRRGMFFRTQYVVCMAVRS